MDRVNGADFVDIGGGRRGFQSQNKAAGQAGTEVTDEWLNGVQENILRVIEEAGLTADVADWSLLWRALSHGVTGRSDIQISGWQAAPPAAPAVGDRYVVAAGAAGAWAGQAQRIAMWTGAAWVFKSAFSGLQANYNDNGIFQPIWFNGATWLALPKSTGLWRFASPGNVANFNLQRTDMGAIYFGRPDGAAVTFTLPDPAVFGVGYIGFLRAGGSNMTINCTGGSGFQFPGNIGVSTVTLNTLKCWLYLICDGANWIIFSADPVLNQRFQQSLAPNGWKMTEDGLLEQWGSSIVTTASELAYVTFPVFFSTECWTVLVTLGDFNSTITDVQLNARPTLGAFQVKTKGFSGPCRINWLAKGK